jgi:mono/diheme cytochrome c family protein
LLIVAAVIGGIALGCRKHVDENELAPGKQRGAALFANHCAACHGPNGRGQALPSPDGDMVVSRDLTTKAFQADRSAEQIHAAITSGVAPWMPAFREVLSPSELQDVTDHVRLLSNPR